MGTFAGSSCFSRPGDIELRSGVVVGRSLNIRRRQQRLPRTPEGSEHTRYCRRARRMGHAFSPFRPSSPTYVRPVLMEVGRRFLDTREPTGDRRLQLF